MIERAYLQVSGPPQAGKTTFIERLLAACRGELLLATRFLSVRKAKDGGPSKGNDETKRYEEAGAIGTMLFRVPPEPDPDAFWSSEFTENYSRGIVIEGEVVEDVVAPDVVVFVLRPLPDGPQLLEQKEVDAGRASIGFVKAMEALVARELESLGGSMSPDLRAKLDTELASIREHASKKSSTRKVWALADGHAGLVRAHVVVINVHDESERPAAERLAAEVRRIRDDTEVAKELVRYPANKRQPAILVANLADAKGKALKKAITRMKKTLSARSDRS